MLLWVSFDFWIMHLFWCSNNDTKDKRMGGKQTLKLKQINLTKYPIDNITPQGEDWTQTQYFDCLRREKLKRKSEPNSVPFLLVRGIGIVILKLFLYGMGAHAEDSWGVAFESVWAHNLKRTNYILQLYLLEESRDNNTPTKHICAKLPLLLKATRNPQVSGWLQVWGRDITWTVLNILLC